MHKGRLSVLAGAYSVPCELCQTHKQFKANKQTFVFVGRQDRQNDTHTDTHRRQS